MLSNSMLFETTSLSDSSLSMPYASSGGESGGVSSGSDSDGDVAATTATTRRDAAALPPPLESEFECELDRQSPRKMPRSAASLRLIQRRASADSTPTTYSARVETQHAAMRAVARDLAAQICLDTHLPRVMQHWSKMTDVGTSFTAATDAPLSYTAIIHRTFQTFAERRIDLRITENDVRLFEDTTTTPTAAYVIPISLLTPHGAKCAAMLVVNWHGVFTRNYSSEHAGLGVPSFSNFLFNDVLDEALDRRALVKCYVDEIAAFAVRRGIWPHVSPTIDGVITHLIVQTSDAIRRCGAFTADGHPRHVSARDVTDAARLRRINEAYSQLRTYVLDERLVTRAQSRCMAEDAMRAAFSLATTTTPPPPPPRER